MGAYAGRLQSLQGWIQDFLRECASQAEMTDVQSQKSAEELPNMHASANCVSWQGTTGLLTALIKYLIVLLEHLDLFAIYIRDRAQQAIGRAWAQPGPPLAMPLPNPLNSPLNFFLFVRCSYKGNWPKAA